MQVVISVSTSTIRTVATYLFCIAAVIAATILVVSIKLTQNVDNGIFVPLIILLGSLALLIWLFVSHLRIVIFYDESKEQLQVRTGLGRILRTIEVQDILSVGEEKIELFSTGIRFSPDGGIIYNNRPEAIKLKTRSGAVYISSNNPEMAVQRISSLVNSSHQGRQGQFT